MKCFTSNSLFQNLVGMTKRTNRRGKQLERVKRVWSPGEIYFAPFLDWLAWSESSDDCRSSSPLPPPSASIFKI